MSNPPGPLLINPNLRVFEAIDFEHALQEDRFDFAYSATIGIFSGEILFGVVVQM